MQASSSPPKKASCTFEVICLKAFSIMGGDSKSSSVKKPGIELAESSWHTSMQ